MASISLIRGLHGRVASVAIIRRACCGPTPTRCMSTESASPLLLRLRNDLKTAMKTKDKNKLNVIRALLNEVSGSAKTTSPIQSDLQLLSLLRKRVASSQAASKEFQDAGRVDLSEREDAEIAILNDYAGDVKTMDGDALAAAVTKVIDELKALGPGTKLNPGDVLKRLIGPDGVLHGQPVEKSAVARLVKQMLG